MASQVKMHQPVFGAAPGETIELSEEKANTAEYRGYGVRTTTTDELPSVVAGTADASRLPSGENARGYFAEDAP